MITKLKKYNQYLLIDDENVKKYLLQIHFFRKDSKTPRDRTTLFERNMRNNLNSFQYEGFRIPI